MQESGGPAEKVAGDAFVRAWAPYHGGVARYSSDAIEVSPDKSGKWSVLRKLKEGLSPRFVRTPLISFTPDDKWAAFHVNTLDRADLMLVENVN
jgi:hypothetical protein